MTVKSISSIEVAAVCSITAMWSCSSMLLVGVEVGDEVGGAGDESAEGSGLTGVSVLGVGVEVATGEGDGITVGLGEGDRSGVAVGVGVGETEGSGVSVGVGVGVDSTGAGSTEGVGSGVGDSLGTSCADTGVARAKAKKTGWKILRVNENKDKRATNFLRNLIELNILFIPILFSGRKLIYFYITLSVKSFTTHTIMGCSISVQGKVSKGQKRYPIIFVRILY